MNNSVFGEICILVLNLISPIKSKLDGEGCVITTHKTEGEARGLVGFNWKKKSNFEYFFIIEIHKNRLKTFVRIL